MVKAGRTIAGSPFGKLDARVETSGQEAMDAFWTSTDLILSTSDENVGLFLTIGIGTTFADQPVTITFKLRPSHTVGILQLPMLFEYLNGTTA